MICGKKFNFGRLADCVGKISFRVFKFLFCYAILTKFYFPLNMFDIYVINSGIIFIKHFAIINCCWSPKTNKSTNIYH